MYRQAHLLLTLILAFASASYKFVDYDEQIENAEYPENITNLASLEEFVKLVEEHNLNVSLIVSSGKNYEEGNLKKAVAMTITFPVNEESITKGTLDKQAFKKLADSANKEKLTVAGTRSENNKLTVYTNNRKGLPINKAYKIFSGIKNGKTGFVFDEENYVAQYTFLIPGNDGKNQTTRVLYGDVDVKVVDKSANVKDNDLAVIKKTLVDTYFTFDSRIVPKALVNILDKQLPEHSWEAAANVGKHNYIDSNYWVTLKILDKNFIVYAS